VKKWGSALAGFLVVAGSVWIARELRQPYRGYSGNLILTIEPGTRSAGAAELLASRGVLAYRWPFLLLYGYGRARRRTIKAGEYLFDRPETPIDVYWKLVQGKIYFHLVVIPEGSDRFDMARILHEQLKIDPEEFLLATQQTALIGDLDPRAPSLEGYLYPDSYRFPAKVDAGTIVQTMVARFRQVIGSRFKDSLGQDPAGLHNTITLASLVEKETPSASERPIIAGVFARRLEKGMRLDCDPTVVYASRISRIVMDPPTAPIGPITRRELEIDSPYNTYRNPGLPPGPICSPGEASIRAAVEPADGQALYFVSNSQGGHMFSSTLAEHHHNVIKYRKKTGERGP